MVAAISGVETYPLDPILANHSYRHICMNRDGTVEHCSDLMVDTMLGPCPIAVNGIYAPVGRWPGVARSNGVWRCGYLARVKDRAMKRANEWRVALVALELWPFADEVSHTELHHVRERANQAIRNSLGSFPPHLMGVKK